MEYAKRHLNHSSETLFIFAPYNNVKILCNLVKDKLQLLVSPYVSVKVLTLKRKTIAFRLQFVIGLVFPCKMVQLLLLKLKENRIASFDECIYAVRCCALHFGQLFFLRFTRFMHCSCRVRSNRIQTKKSIWLAEAKWKFTPEAQQQMTNPYAIFYCTRFCHQFEKNSLISFWCARIADQQKNACIGYGSQL